MHLQTLLKMLAICAITFTNPAFSQEIRIIPVVFHILHTNGAENISDAQVKDAIIHLNNDFRKRNTDTTSIASQFKGIRADMKIEFRLATLDPNGNCTTGIEHIYTHLTDDADDDSKIHQWPRENYLNIWTVKSIGEVGIAAATYYPNQTIGNESVKDGILVLHDYVGSIGTSTPFVVRELTHIAARYFGLPNTWGFDAPDGCGDDGIADTPPSSGTVLCDTTAAPCGSVENIQNFMSNSYCRLMFTAGQAAFLNDKLGESIAGRNHLYTNGNLQATGTADTTSITCLPVAGFTPVSKNVCVGNTVTYKDASSGKNITARSWSFPGGNPSTSTDLNPVVTYTTEGFYDASLTVTNAAGNAVKTITNAVYISPDWVENTGPATETFDSTGIYWLDQNPDNNRAYFQRATGVGRNGSNCYLLNNYFDNSGSAANSDDANYYKQLGGSVDELISESYDLSRTTTIVVSFDYAYATEAKTTEGITEVLNVYSSRDCGKTWQKKTTVEYAELTTSADHSHINFVPQNAEWKTLSFAYFGNQMDSRTRFRLEFIASDSSNNLYIDNFNVQGILGIEDNAASFITISPNPVSSGSAVSVEIPQSDMPVQLQLTDVNGALLSTSSISTAGGIRTVLIPVQLVGGCYFIQAICGDVKSTHRIIVY